MKNFEKFLSLMEDFLCVLNEDGVITWTNPTFKRRLNIDVFGKKISSLIQREDQVILQGVWQSILEGEPISNMELRLLDPENDAFIWGLWSLVKSQEDDHIYVVGRDITNRKKRQEEIEIVLKSLPDLYFRLDRNYTYIDVKHGDTNKPLVPANQIIGLTVKEVFPPHLAEPIENALDKMFATNEIVTIEYQLSGEDSMKDFEARCIPTSNGQAIAIVREVTRLKKAEKKIIRQAQALQLFFEGLPDLYVRYNATGHVLNIKAGKVWRPYTPMEELVGKHISEYLPKQLANLFLGHIQNVIETQQPVMFNFTIPKNNQLTYNEARVNPSINEEAIVVIRDVTQQYKQRIALERMNKELSRSNKDLEQFAYIASHDLQEPLRKIAAFIERIEKVDGQNLSQKGLLYFDRVISATKRMEKLIDDLLAYSRVLGAIKNKEDVDLNEELKGVVSDIELKLLEKNGTIVTDKLPVITGNKVQIRQLFQNLLTNAIKFASEKRPLEIQIKHKIEDSFLTIKIIDNGIGFEENYKELIFQPFKRLHSRHEYEGTGIGLALCRKITYNLGGDLNAYGEKDKGATFEIILPLLKK